MVTTDVTCVTVPAMVTTYVSTTATAAIGVHRPSSATPGYMPASAYDTPGYMATSASAAPTN